MIRGVKAKHFGIAQDVTAMYALLQEGTHTKRVDLELIFTQAEQIFLLATLYEQSVKLGQTFLFAPRTPSMPL